jgi:signal transduction histidine kinase
MSYDLQHITKSLYQAAAVLVERNQEAARIAANAEDTWARAIVKYDTLTSQLERIKKLEDAVENNEAALHLTAAMDELRAERANIARAIHDALHRMTCIRVELNEDSCRLEF